MRRRSGATGWLWAAVATIATFGTACEPAPEVPEGESDGETDSEVVNTVLDAEALSAIQATREAVFTFAVLNEWYYSENGRFTADLDALEDSEGRGEIRARDSVRFEVEMGDDGQSFSVSATHARTGPGLGCAFVIGTDDPIETPGGLPTREQRSILCDGDLALSLVDQIELIESAIERYVQATSERDTTTIRELLVNDGRFAWIEEGRVAYRSVDALLDGLDSFEGGDEIRTTLHELRVVPVGESGARAWARFDTVVGQRRLVFDGMLTFILERTDAGWRIVGGQAS